MKKMFKAVATLAVGCALLSTSAFAADTISGTVEKDATGAAVTINGYETSAQSTILVVKDTAVLEAIPSNLADSAIAYINQSAVAEKKAVYDVNVTGDGVYTVFAGGSDVAAATKIGSFEIKSAPAVVPVTGVTIGTVAEDVFTAAADSMFAKTGSTLTFAAEVLPANATDKTVTWTSSDEDKATVVDGVVTVKTGVAGDVTITAANGEINDSITLTIYTPGDVTGSVAGVIDINDVDAAHQMSLNLGTWTDVQKLAADVVGAVAGTVDINDVDAIHQKSLNLSVEFK